MHRIVWAMVVLAGCGNASSDIADLTGDAAAGAEIYAASCSGCHAEDGTGASGPSLVEETPSKEETIEVVFSGEGDMPAFSESLSDQDIADVTAFVTTGL